MLGKRKDNKRGQAVIELTPLIDMVFILLIFFIVTTSFVKVSSVKIDSPKSSRAMSQIGSFLNIVVTENGKVFAENSIINPQDSQRIKAMLTKKNCSKVIINGDRHAPLGIILSLQDTCIDAGAKIVQIGAESK